MNFLHYSDRGDERLFELFSACDILITTGDLSIFDFTAIIGVIRTKPAFGVYGNHCVPGYLEELGITNLHLNIVRYKDLSFAGYQGSPRYKEGGGPQFDETQAVSDLGEFPGVDIFLLHAPPFGLLDTPGDRVHQGSKAVRDYVERTKPKYVFCGHESPSLDLEYLGIKIFRTHKARLINLSI